MSASEKLRQLDEQINKPSSEFSQPDYPFGHACNTLFGCLPEIRALVDAAARVPGLNEPWYVNLSKAYAALERKLEQA